MTLDDVDHLFYWKMMVRFFLDSNANHELTFDNSMNERKINCHLEVAQVNIDELTEHWTLDTVNSEQSLIPVYNDYDK